MDQYEKQPCSLCGGTRLKKALLSHMGNYWRKKLCKTMDTMPPLQVATKVAHLLRLSQMMPGMATVTIVASAKDLRPCNSRCRNMPHRHRNINIHSMNMTHYLHARRR